MGEGRGRLGRAGGRGAEQIKYLESQALWMNVLKLCLSAV